MEKITIVVPCYNEQEVVEKFHAEVSHALQEIPDCEFTYLFINDGSSDGTLALLQALAKREPSVKYLSLSRNFGKEPAMLAGLDYAEGDAVINVGVSGPGVVKTALERVRGADFETLCETIKKTAFKITRVGQLVAQEASRRLNVPFGIIDLSLAPTPAVGDSVADILCEIGLEYAGAPGTTAALAMMNDQVKKGGVMAWQSV